MPGVLFVCTGNTCRSPMAEGLARSLVPGVSFFSRGLFAKEGDSASALALAVLRERYGVDMAAHTAGNVKEQDVSGAALILAMTRAHRDSLIFSYPTAADKTFLIKELAGLAGDVSDPFGGKASEYAACADEINKCILLIDFNKYI